MFRFTIRAVLWLTVVVALAVGWWLDRSKLERRASRAIKSGEAARLGAHELMEEFDVIHPGWRGAKWHEWPEELRQHEEERVRKYINE